jgi:hypothetical protein
MPTRNPPLTSPARPLSQRLVSWSALVAVVLGFAAAGAPAVCAQGEPSPDASASPGPVSVTPAFPASPAAALPAAAGSPAPGPSPAAKTGDEVPEAYRRLLATLRARHEAELPPADLLFGRAEAPDISTIRVREIRPSAKGGLGLVLEDDTKEFRVYDIV